METERLSSGLEPDLDVLLDLVGAVYDVALSPDGWDPLLERLTQVLGGTATVFFVQDQRTTVQFARAWGLPPRALEEYESHFAPLDHELETLLALPAGSLGTDESTPPEVHRKSEFFNEFRRPWDVERYIGGVVFRDLRRLGVLVLEAPRRHPPFGAAESALLGRLIPHLRRAVQVRSHLDQALTRKRALEDTLDRLTLGVVLLDESGLVVHANAAAQRIVERRDGLTIARRRLHAASDAANAALGKAIAEAIDTTRRTGLAEGATLAVPRPSGERPYAVLVSPGPGSDSESVFQSASAVVLIGDPEARIEAPEQLAARLYGLTPSEARVAIAVASGESLESYAGLRGINVSTARFQMKQVLAKTGARRQADLVRLLLTGPVAALNRRE